LPDIFHKETSIAPQGTVKRLSLIFASYYEAIIPPNRFNSKNIQLISLME
jgi:hypothetical protein